MDKLGYVEYFDGYQMVVMPFLGMKIIRQVNGMRSVYLECCVSLGRFGTDIE